MCLFLFEASDPASNAAVYLVIIYHTYNTKHAKKNWGCHRIDMLLKGVSLPPLTMFKSNLMKRGTTFDNQHTHTYI